MNTRKSVMFAPDEHKQLKLAATEAGESIRGFVISRIFGDRQMEVDNDGVIRTIIVPKHLAGLSAYMEHEKSPESTPDRPKNPVTLKPTATFDRKKK